MLLLSSTPRLPPIQVLLAILAVALGIYYLSLVASRPAVPTAAQVQDPDQYGWPDWYTGPVMPRETRGKPARVLLLIDHHSDSINRPATYALIPQMHAQSYLDVTVWGPDASDWDSERTASENLESAGCPWDWIWRRGDGPQEAHGCPDSVWVDDVPDQGELDPLSDVNLMHNPMDMLSDKLAYPKLSNGAENWKMPLIGHVPPSADPQEFYPSKVIAFHRSITYFPKSTTPRGEWPSMPWGKTWKIYHPHEPQFVNDSEVYDEKSKVARRYRAERERLASAMRSAGICVFEEWAAGVVNDRYAQAMMSGCLVASVSPATNHDAMRNLLLIVPEPLAGGALPLIPHDGISESELKRRKVEAVAYARHHFAPHERISAVEHLVQQWQLGSRGYVFPASFRLDCESSNGRMGWCGDIDNV